MEEPRPARTRVVAGIDEAGLGPLLGPLVLGYAVLEVPRGTRDVWALLAPDVARAPDRADRALAVADSKQLFDRTPRGAARLETTALAFLAQARCPPSAPRDAAWMFAPPLAPSPRWIAAHPWCGELDEPLPLHAGAENLAERARSLALRLASAGAAVRAAGVRVVPEGELNDCMRGTGSKSEALWLYALAILRRAWDEHGAHFPLVVCDRHGGRTRYAALLAHGFPDADVRVVRESRALSEYELRGHGCSMRLRFAVRADARSFPVALASCLAKYARETAMRGFNRYFAGLQPNLRATAGYVQDARRWLGDAGPALARARLARELLVRER